MSDHTDAFGVIYSMPDMSQIKSIRVQGQSYYSDYSDGFTVSSDDGKRAVLDLQSKALDEYRKDPQKYKDNYNSYFSEEDRLRTHSLDICYTLKNGTIKTRYYILDYNTWSACPELWLTDEYAKNASENAKYIFEPNERRENEQRISSKLLYDINYKKISSSELADEFSEAYYKDLCSLTKEEFMSMDTYCIINDISISSAFTNTISVLEKYNIEIPDVHQDASDITQAIKNASIYTENKYTYENYSNLYFSDSEYLKSNLNMPPDSILVTNCFYSPKQQYCINDTFDSETLEKLLNAAQPHYATDKKCYIIKTCNDQQLMIPPEYTELAEEFISSSCHKNG